jgi:PAS domain S-box-containing protein
MDGPGDPHFLSIFELAAVGLAEVDLQGRFRNANARYCEFLGTTREALCKRNIRDVSHPDDLGSELELNAALLEGRIEHFTIDKRYVRTSGRVVWGQLSVGLVRDAQGQPQHFVRSVLDITERKHSEAQLRQRDELLAKLSEHVPGVLFQYRCGTDGWESIPYASQGLKSMYGMEPATVRNDARPMHRQVLQEDRRGLHDSMERSRLELVPWVTEYRVAAPGGQTRWHACRAWPERAPDGATLWYGCVVDVTDQRRVAERLVAAGAAERAKNEFLSRMSHELRTPLNAVLGFAQLLRLDSRATLTTTQLAQVQHIERAGAQLLELINDVLELSRIEEGALALTPEAVSLGELVDETLALHQSAAQEAGVRLLRVPRTDAAVHVQADRIRLGQVVAHLVGNAVKYNRRGGEVQVLWQRTQDSRARLEVVDTGPGLSAGQLAHLFEPFNRLGAERSGVDGTGTGLVLTRRLLRLMGGDIEVHSREGLGSRFVALLPLARDDGAPPDASAVQEPGRWRVLYAEDNLLNVELVRQLLALRPSVSLTVARSGAEALRAAREDPPHLVLLDMHLGDASGLDVAREFAKDPRLADCPRVVLSADAMAERMDAARQAGIADYLTKPLDVSAFFACLDRHLADVAARGTQSAPS